MRNQGESLVKILSRPITLALESKSKDLVMEAIEGVKETGEYVFCAVFDENNKLFIQNNMNEDTENELKQILGGQITEGKKGDIKKSIKGNLLLLQKPLLSGKNKIGTLFLGLTLRGVFQAIAQYFYISIVFVGVLVIAGIATGWVFANKIGGSISQLTNFSESLASRAGDLTQTIQIQSKDEMGRLAGYLTRMIGNIREIVKAVKSTADKVTVLASGVASSIQQVNGSGQGISTSIQQISKGVIIQTKKANEAMTGTEEMVESIKQIVMSVSQSFTSSLETSKLAQAGMETAKQTVDKINCIMGLTDEISGVVGELGKRSQKIGGIVEVISNIADQTNLLALNAAIEAARAGEAGRGFAVVSEEVKKLAENSAQAAKEISNLVRAIQKEISSTVTSVGLAAKEVQEGSTIVKKTHNLLERILAAAKSTNAMGEQISTATERQMSNTQVVDEAIKEIASISEESASGIQETSSSLEEMSASLEEVASTAQELVDIANSLNALVKEFKTG
ncbi:MAG: HAMP domain-containing protein [Candidatus Omnitrophica bacterium]|nr:HAMP domain-containing protein [Candidatus Omnitrophota bacterium]MBU4477661.1 HAMP domain-containing protein [Candidatus Omnitrophota bacterium]